MAKNDSSAATTGSLAVRVMNPTHAPISLKARMGDKMFRLDVAPMQEAEIPSDFAEAVRLSRAGAALMDELVPVNSADAKAAAIDAERERRAAVASGSEDQGPISMPVAAPVTYNPSLLSAVKDIKALRESPNLYTGVR